MKCNNDEIIVGGKGEIAVVKKLLCFVIAISVALSCTLGLCEEKIDLSGLSYDELVALKDRINLAIWNSEDWQEVTVPQGVWKVGEDIPAGTWTVRCADIGRDGYMMRECDFSWGENLAKNGLAVEWKGRYDLVTIYNPNNEYYKEGYLTEYTFTVQNGDYIIIDGAYNKAVFTPYAGKPSLGFK